MFTEILDGAAENVHTGRLLFPQRQTESPKRALPPKGFRDLKGAMKPGTAIPGAEALEPAP